MNNKDLTLVIPVYNEEDSLAALFQWIFRVVDNHRLDTEIIIIDDGSTDHSWETVIKEARKDKRIIGYRFNRNYGKSAALNTGFKYANGSVVITLDADLQDNPEEIPELIHQLKSKNLDMVSGWKQKRNDPIGKTLPSKLFNWVTRRVSGIKLHDFNCGIKAYKKEVIKNIQIYGEMHRYIPLIAKWNGFDKIEEKKVKHQARKFGVSKYGTRRLFTGFLDLLSVTFIYRFKKNPMHFFGIFGSLFFFVGFVIAGWLIFEKLYRLNYGLPVREIVNQPLFFLALVALIMGVQLFLAGFLAEIIQNKEFKDDYLIIDQTD